jgi:DNA (cytosine-5)-methyltransferase 1
VKVGSLFSGIGGFDLGLERAGFETVWFCEQDEFCQRVLAKHWPGVPIYPDICQLKGSDVEPVDALCGGFPCQDLSYAGRGAGIEGERSGLWSEFARVIGELRPQYVFVENVPALLNRGLGRVLGDLAQIGYDAEWDCVPASAVGAPHRRDRIWLVGYPNGLPGSSPGELKGRSEALARSKKVERPFGSGGGSREKVADPNGEGSQGHRGSLKGSRERSFAQGRLAPGGPTFWTTEPDVGRMVNGVPHRVDRLKALGNALVPQVAEWVGRRVMEWEGDYERAA